MERTPLCKIQIDDHPDIIEIAKEIHSGRYFHQLDLNLIIKMLRQGELITLERDDLLIKEGDDSPAELFILIEGALAVESQGKFILRLEYPGDVVGEMGVIHPARRSADVVAESQCRLVAFSQKMFEVPKDAESASILYVMFTHILADKLRMTTAQSLIRKNERVKSEGDIVVGVIDPNFSDRLLTVGLISSQWNEAKVVEIEDPLLFIENPMEHRFQLIIADVEFAFPEDNNQREMIAEFCAAAKSVGAPVFIVSHYCNASAGREHLMELGIDELLPKPFSIPDLKHAISKYRVWYYKHKQLDKAEHDAETDRLTGLANRRRMDEFLEALFTLYPENKQPFSLIISDVDNFKHYNDTHGHQMGDIVLARVGSLFNQNVRRGDLAARFGGEEFVMILPNCEMDVAIQVAEKLRSAIEEDEFPFQDQQPTGNLTATFGVATFPLADNLDDLLKKADDCLYRGKEAGRNVVICANEPTA